MTPADRDFAAAKLEHTMRRATALGMTHGRTCARRLEGFVLVVFCLACVVAFFALALGLALLILAVLA